MSITILQPTVNPTLQTLDYDAEYYKKTMKAYDKVNLRTDSTALSPYAFLVLLLALCNVNAFVFTEKYFMTKLDISKPTLIKALRELEIKGYHTKVSDDGRMVYLFSEVKKERNELISGYKKINSTIQRVKYDCNTTYKRIPKGVITWNSLSINARRLLIFGIHLLLDAVDLKPVVGNFMCYSILVEFYRTVCTYEFQFARSATVFSGLFQALLVILDIGIYTLDKLCGNIKPVLNPAS